jgi:hypothetical protein
MSEQPAAVQPAAAPSKKYRRPMTPRQLEQHAARMRLDSSERRLEELMQSIHRRPESYRKKKLRAFWEEIRRDQELSL